MREGGEEGGRDGGCGHREGIYKRLSQYIELKENKVNTFSYYMLAKKI